MTGNILKKLVHIEDENLLSVETKKEIEEMMGRIKEYWLIYDLEFGTIHCKVFAVLYIDCIGINYDDAADLLNVDRRTIDRYVAKYNKLTKRIIERDYRKICELLFID